MEEKTDFKEEEEFEYGQTPSYSTVTVVQSGEASDDGFDFEEDDELLGLQHLRSPAFQDPALEPQEMHCSLVFCFREGEEEREILLGLSSFRSFFHTFFSLFKE